MKVIYDKEEERIVLKIAQEESYDSQIICMDHCDYDAGYPTMHFWIDESIPLDIATKLFQRWHQICQSAKPEFIARALNDALNSELEIKAKTGNHEESDFRAAPLYPPNYSYTHFNVDALLCVFRGTGLYCIENDNDSVKHNITEDRVEYFIDDKLKGWLPIVRKEITS